ncbi:MAG: glycoside hydrolase family 78 protein [Planctomycetaceae bacterium]|jgi:alpha-L-rhamnosidase|nr:glycoside hydrolase family 78 protein [Planctomycetaceae bacterium]
MLRLLFLPLVFWTLTPLTFAFTPLNLQTEYQTNPLGIDNPAPRFSWQTAETQTAYHFIVKDGDTVVRDSGKIESPQSFLVPFGGKLKSNTKYIWKVQVFSKDGNASEWSEPATFVTGILDEKEWHVSQWLKHPTAPEEKAVWFRKKFNVNNPQSTLIHVASVGYHELYINGKKADDRVLAPVLTRFKDRTFYVTYDAAQLLQNGENVIAVWAASGWAANETMKLPFIFRVQSDLVKSDDTWKCAVSNYENTRRTPIWTKNGGEKIDARNAQPGWNALNFDDSSWDKPKTVEFNTKLISHSIIAPTRIIETYKPVKITGENPYKIEFAKNFTGWVKVDMSGLAAGETVNILTADDEKTVCDFDQKSIYIAAGKEKETFCNKFNYAAGRFVTIEGLKKKPELDDITGFALATDLKRTGYFSSSNEIYNKIYETDLWTFRACTPEGFTMDCPHRERMGYGEVATATSWGIGFPAYETGSFYKKIVQDWIDVQEPNGWVNHTAPQFGPHYGGPMWSSGGLNVAWEHYVNFADKTVIELIYPSAKKWLDFLHTNSKDGLVIPYKGKWWFLGDWAAPGGRKETGDSPEAQYFNNCVYAMNLESFIRIAGILNHPEDAELYGKRLDILRRNIHQTFYNNETGMYSKGTQVQQAFALSADIVPGTLRASVLEKLSADMQKRQYFDMGSSGLPVLIPYLANPPRDEVTAVSALTAQILNRTEKPGFGYFVKMGETTWPEYWEIDVPSRIHTCYTGIAGWFVKGLCGILPDYAHPGYKSFIIRPQFVKECDWAEASVESPYGKIVSRWERGGDSVTLNVTVPANSTATVILPDREPVSVGTGVHRFQVKE